MGIGSNIVKLVFGFSRTKSFNLLSKLIELVEKKPFSHCYVRLPEPTGVEVVFQASGLAVNLDSFEGFCTVETPVEEYEVDLSNEQYMMTWRYIIARLGTPYSVVQLFRILIKKIAGIETGHNKGQSEICSELMTHLCEYLKIEGPEDSDYVDPSAFNRFCKSNMKQTLGAL